MEGTNPPLLKGAGLSGTLAILPSNGAAEKLLSGRVGNGGPGQASLGRMEGVPAGRLRPGWGSLQPPPVAFTFIPSGPTPSPGPRRRPENPFPPAREPPPPVQGASCSRSTAPVRVLGGGRGRSCSVGGWAPPATPRLAPDGGRGGDRSGGASPPSHRRTQRRHARTRARAAALPGAAVRTHTRTP
jgi:hypothetical protein